VVFAACCVLFVAVVVVVVCVVVVVVVCVLCWCVAVDVGDAGAVGGVVIVVVAVAGAVVVAVAVAGGFDYFIYVCIRVVGGVQVVSPLRPFHRKTSISTHPTYFQRTCVSARMGCCAPAVVPHRRCDLSRSQNICLCVHNT